MKIGYFADGPWSHYALEKIIKDPRLKIVFIVARYPQPDEKLRLYSEQLKVPFLVDLNVNSVEFIDIIKGCAPDINVSMSFNQILKGDILKVAPLGFINCHAGQLPFYRGRNVLNWALINGESHFGVTVHYIDIGIDTGDIILQKLEPIENTDDYQSLLNKAYRLCGETLYDALLMLQQGDNQVIKQSSIHPVGFYCGRRIIGDEYIDWNWNSRLIYNFVRAIVPPAPGARTFLNDSEIVILKTELIDNAPTYIGVPGEVIGTNDKGVVIKTGDSTIQITQIGELDQNGELINIRIPLMKIGTRLGFFNPWIELRNLRQKVNQLQIMLNTEE
ncbi:methionyl-tRNA formyltransferase [Syntrophomonas wolfei]|uniref:methionyl-tRNA formyltransferase n=1 Tax=Syntrophomonas wolfei TaxID=863 RepID=UPI000773EC7A|nr:methionyl-tRNA formyltransferase [Syntrophomonas wolfei]